MIRVLRDRHAIQDFQRRNGIESIELALGTGMFGQAWGYGVTPDEVSRIIAGFADAGGNFIDIADNYQHGVSETLVGEAIAVNRDDFNDPQFLFSKQKGNCSIAVDFTAGKMNFGDNGFALLNGVVCGLGFLYDQIPMTQPDNPTFSDNPSFPLHKILYKTWKPVPEGIHSRSEGPTFLTRQWQQTNHFL